jgi:hypothetical protein
MQLQQAKCFPSLHTSWSISCAAIFVNIWAYGSDNLVFNGRAITAPSEYSEHCCCYYREVHSEYFLALGKVGLLQRRKEFPVFFSEQSHFMIHLLGSTHRNTSAGDGSSCGAQTVFA